MTRRKRGLAIGAAALAAVGGGAGIAASASGGFGGDRTAFIGEVASKLGVTPDRLQQAITAAFDDRLDAAVKAGTLTQAQADAIKARQAAGGGIPLIGPLPEFGGRHGPVFGVGIMQPDTMEAAAAYLGLTTDQLLTRLRSGKTLAEIAMAHGKTPDGLKAALVAAARKDLDAAVAAGKLTRSQADDILSSLQQRFDDVISGQPAFGRGWRRGVMPIP